jgi:hypothetical protein
MTSFSGGLSVDESRAIAMTSLAATGALSGRETGHVINLGGEGQWH